MPPCTAPTPCLPGSPPPLPTPPPGPTAALPLHIRTRLPVGLPSPRDFAYPGGDCLPSRSPHTLPGPILARKWGLALLIHRHFPTPLISNQHLSHPHLLSRLCLPLLFSRHHPPCPNPDKESGEPSLAYTRGLGFSKGRHPSRQLSCSPGVKPPSSSELNSISY